MYISPALGPTSWASQILSNIVFAIGGPPGQLRLSPAETTARKAASRAVGFSKWWGRSASKVTRVALVQLVAGAVADEHDRALLDERGLAAAGLVDEAGRRPA